MASSFKLSKWYMDCVSDDGAVVIGYATRLGWRRLAKGYASTLEAVGDAPPRTRVSARGFEPPVLDGETLRWSCRPLGVSGEWNALEPSFGRTLFEDAAGSVDWTCLFPRARVSVEGPWNGGSVRGLGYVERLEMTLNPARLPIDELRWGRFLGPDASIVWIEWRGPRPLDLVFRGGAPERATVLGDDGIEFADGSRLFLEERAVLREGRLGDTVLSGQRALRRLLPRRLLETSERKWRSRGRLVDARGAESRGWALHETVRWKPD